MAGIITYLFVSYTQTYTCTLHFEYTYEGADKGLAPDGAEGTKLNPYEIMSPVVIKAALKDMGIDDEGVTVETIRSCMDVSEVITSYDSEVKESAAVLGEKYEVIPTEYILTYEYNARWGTAFGNRLLESVIKSYDDWLEKKYHNKKSAGAVIKAEDTENLDYMDISEIIRSNITSNIDYLDALTEKAPDFRSHRTGYSFSEITNLYWNLNNIQYSKYYANVRQGRLSRDNEMLVKNYAAKVKDLSEQAKTKNAIAENYKNEITQFYEPYKKSGLYNQASRTQNALNSTNENAGALLENYDLSKIINTYDNIITSYIDNGKSASELTRQVEFYNNIINEFSNDTVPYDVKERLIEKNKIYLQDIFEKSENYQKIANDTISEYYEQIVAGELEYLLTTDINATKPVKFITVFVMVLVGGILLIGFVFYELFFAGKDEHLNNKKKGKNKINLLDEPEELDNEHYLAYMQFKKGFNEMFLVYQPMFECKTGKCTHSEAFIRWKSPQLGDVAPGVIIDYFTELGLYSELSKWILETICKDIVLFDAVGLDKHVIHVNCLDYDLEDQRIAGVIVNILTKYNIEPSRICLEVDGGRLLDLIDDIILLNDLNIKLCIDKFENKENIDAIIEAVVPDYIKISDEIFNPSIYATTNEDTAIAMLNIYSAIDDIVDKCQKNKVKCCVCGIETKQQNHILEKSKVDFKQGYYYGKPAAVKEHISSIIESEILQV